MKVCPTTATATYASSDEKVATVDADGKITGVAAGEATITATTDYGKTATAKVTVKKMVLTDAKQTKADQIVATVKGDTTGLKATDFTITNTATNATVPVKAVSVDKTDKTKVTIDTFTEMKDAKEYNVVLDGVTVKFTATDGTVANVALSRAQIPAAEKTEVKAQSLDANGVVIKEFAITNKNPAKGQVSVDLTITKGYAEEKGVYLPAVGDTMTAKLVYHTGTFGTDGNETGAIEQTFTITAIDPSLVNYNFQVTIGDKAPDWKATSFKACTDVKIGAERNAYFRITKDDGNEISNYSDYTVETADRTKLLVTDTTLTNSSTVVKVNGVSEGLTYIEFKKDGNVVGTVAVNVKAKPVATTLDLDKTTITVVRDKTYTETAYAEIKDQYGDHMDAASQSVEIIGAPDDDSKTAATGALTTEITADGKVKATISGDKFNATCKKGSYTYKIKAKNGDKELTRALTVTLVETADVQAYELKVSQSKVNTTIGTTTVNDSNESNYDIAIDVAKMANGGALGNLESDTPVKYTVKDSTGKTIACVGKNIDGTALTLTTCAAIDSNITGNKLTIDTLTVVSGAGIKKNIDKGTYNVIAEFYSDYGTNKKPVQVSASFTIEDTQDTGVSYKLIKNDFEGNTVKAAFTNTTYVEVYYDGVLQTITAVDDVDGTYLSNGGAFVKSVSLYVKVSNSDNYVCVKVPVNDQVAKCGGLK